jgi:D-3-phosphoglycerate dehydrogenase
MGQGVTGRTLGIVGLGNIGRELAMLARPLDLRIIANDPWVPANGAADAGVALVALPDLLRQSAFVAR